eukprot:TRINITY_DN35573_c0_g1_i1.p1 TRINITY_DN35573_c0_g1~~TRINITY_DN35573_c0_g1_i1.p1  ORF type:complete len:176 (-),score=18.35 TRINITY_DN35573_c0_g1_i1:70-576(-)
MYSSAPAGETAGGASGSDMCLPKLPLQRKVSLNDDVTVIDITPLPSCRSNSSPLPPLRKSKRRIRKDSEATSSDGSQGDQGSQGSAEEDTNAPTEKTVRRAGLQRNLKPIRRITSMPAALPSHNRAAEFMDFFKVSEKLGLDRSEALQKDSERRSPTAAQRLEPLSSP